MSDGRQQGGLCLFSPWQSRIKTKWEQTSSEMERVSRFLDVYILKIVEIVLKDHPPVSGGRNK